MGFIVVLAWLVVACILIETGRALDHPIMMAIGGAMVLLTACIVQIG